MEYCFRAGPVAKPNTIYYFRLSNAGNPYGAYTAFAKLTIENTTLAAAPNIAVSNQTLAGGVQWYYQLYVAGSRPMTYSVQGLPAGITRTGTILSGRPTAYGTFPVSVTASNASGSDTKVLTLIVSEPVSEVIVDDQDKSGISRSGNVYSPEPLSTWMWGASATSNLAWNGMCLYSLVPGNARSPMENQSEQRVWFRWTPNLPMAAQYDVYARWTSAALRGRHVPYTIGHAGGTNTVLVDQRDPALSAKWNLLGRYTFNLGTSGWVELGGNDGQACADAIRFVRVGSSGANQAPTAAAQNVSTAEDTAKAITLTGSDPEGSPLTYTVVTQPAHGMLSGTAPSVTYNPTANYNGADSFTFRVNDGTTNSAAATISITVTSVNDAPTCALTAPANGATFTAPASITLQANASDVDGTIANVEFFNGATKLGTDTNSPYAYTWSGVTAGSYTLTVKATDNNSVTTTSASVIITVTSAVNQAPTANAQSVSTAEDTAKAITLTGSDPEGAALTYSIVANPAHGTLTGTGASRTYTPAANYNGADSFTFKVSDGALTSTPATVSITVTAVNDTPTVTAGGTPANGTAPLTVVFTAAGSDVDGDTLSYSWAFGDGQSSTAQNPNHLYASAGVYTATVTVNDGKGGTASKTVAITVTAAGGGETVIVTIQPDAAYDIGAGQESATVTIKDNTHLETPTVSVVATDATAAEPGTTVNTGMFTFSRTSRFHEALTVSYAIGGTASNGVDYNVVSGAVTIPAGVATKTLTIVPKADAVTEGAETVVLTIQSSAAYAIATGKGAATMTIAETGN